MGEYPTPDDANSVDAAAAARLERLDPDELDEAIALAQLDKEELAEMLAEAHETEAPPTEQDPTDAELDAIGLDRKFFSELFIPEVHGTTAIPPYRKWGQDGDDRTMADHARESIGLPTRRLTAYGREIYRKLITAGGENGSINPDNAYRIHLNVATHEIPSGELAGTTVEVIGWREWVEGQKSPYGKNGTQLANIRRPIDQ